MSEAETVKSEIRKAFSHVQYPGNWCLRGSNEGDEPYLLEEEFQGKTDWRTLDARFLDESPGGFGSALSFFSDEAFHFYLPAYLIADIDGALEQHDPVFNLTHGLTDQTKTQLVNPRRHGDRTWFEESWHNFAMLNQNEVDAIVAYLRLKRRLDEFQRKVIDQALRNYWCDRASANSG